MRVRAPLIPEVALVELPPKKAEKSAYCFETGEMDYLTLLIENEDVSTIEVDGVGGTETGHCNGQQRTILRRREITYIHHRRR